MELAEARRRARYSQQQVADQLRVSRPTYRKLEENPEIVTIADAKILAKLFDVEVSEIFFDDTYS